jgi:hypothetical protein
MARGGVVSAVAVLMLAPWATFAETWKLGGLPGGKSCTEICSTVGLACVDGDWGVHDEASFRSALAAAGEDFQAVCPDTTKGRARTNKGYDWQGNPHISDHGCNWKRGKSNTSCRQPTSAEHARRLCRCLNGDDDDRDAP